MYSVFMTNRHCSHLKTVLSEDKSGDSSLPWENHLNKLLKISLKDRLA